MSSLGDLLHRDVETGAGPRRSIVDLAGIGLGVGDELGERLPRRIVLHHHPEGVAAYPDDVGEIRGRIERRLLHERKTEHRDRHLRDRVAVGLGGGSHLAGPERAGAARPVLDHERLAEMPFSRARERAHADIGSAPGRPRHDQGHRSRREILRLRGAVPTSQGQRSAGQSRRKHCCRQVAFHDVSSRHWPIFCDRPEDDTKLQATSDHFSPQSQACVGATIQR
jgi:hypothetical protein